MTTITVYDPPLCCATGVCGTSVDPKLAQFAGDLEWLRVQGIAVQRYNLAQEPEKFIENTAVKAVLERSGDEELPVILAGEELVSCGRFPGRDELAQFAGLEIEATPSAVAREPGSSCCSGNSTGCC